MKITKKAFLVLFLAFICLFSFQVQAASVTKAASYSLSDVRKAPKVTGEWVKTSSGIKFKQVTETGTTYLKSKWINVDNSIYYLNKKGKRTTGWILYKKNYYYMQKSTGKLMTSCWINNKKYYLKENGQRATGVLTLPDGQYYFSDKGVKKTGWITYKKRKYYFSPTTGRKVTSKWIKDKKNWKYVDAHGAMKKSSWIVIGDKRYYVNGSGNRVTGEQYIGSKWCYFDKNGVYDPNKKISINIDPSKKMVALTFDDGPGPYTASLLSCLRSNNARATFFMVGSSVGSYSSVVKQMYAQHCELGNHSYTHANLANLSTSGIESEISRTNKAIKAAAGVNPTVARLPYGSGHDSSRVLGALHLPSIYWSIDTRDWANTGNPQSTINATLNNVKSGDIVLMHDIHQSTVTAAKTIIPRLRERGYQMVTVSELAKYKGKKALSSGKTYYNFR